MFEHQGDALLPAGDVGRRFPHRPMTKELQEAQGQVGHQRQPPRFEVLLTAGREVEEQVGRVGLLGAQERSDLGRHLADRHQFARRARRRPRLVAVVDHDREDRRQRARAGMVLQPAVPDAHAIAQQLQRGQAERARLVVEDDVQQQRLAAERGGEQQVGLAFRQVDVDEAAVEPDQRMPVDGARHRGRQQPAQQFGRLGGLAEHEPEQRVVRTDRFHGITGPPVHRASRAVPGTWEFPREPPRRRQWFRPGYLPSARGSHAA